MTGKVGVEKIISMQEIINDRRKNCLNDNSWLSKIAMDELRVKMNNLRLCWIDLDKKQKETLNKRIKQLEKEFKMKSRGNYYGVEYQEEYCKKRKIKCKRHLKMEV